MGAGCDEIAILLDWVNRSIVQKTTKGDAFGKQQDGLQHGVGESFVGKMSRVT